MAAACRWMGRASSPRLSTSMPRPRRPGGSTGPRGSISASTCRIWPRPWSFGALRGGAARGRRRPGCSEICVGSVTGARRLDQLDLRGPDGAGGGRPDADLLGRISIVDELNDDPAVGRQHRLRGGVQARGGRGTRRPCAGRCAARAVALKIPHASTARPRTPPPKSHREERGRPSGRRGTCSLGLRMRRARPDLHGAPAAHDRREPPRGPVRHVYVHVPFCRAKCDDPRLRFAGDRRRAGSWSAGPLCWVAAERERAQRAADDVRRLHTLDLGGGTP